MGRPRTVLTGALPGFHRRGPELRASRHRANLSPAPGSPAGDCAASPASAPPEVYLEARSALNGRLLAYGLLPPALAVTCLIFAVATAQPWLGDALGLLIALSVASSGLLYRNWPTGIRIDESGITIGAVLSVRAFHRRPTVNHQSWGLYTCPWPAVQSTRIVTARDELRQITKSPRNYTLTNRWGSKPGMFYCNIGVLTSPFMRAALVVEVNQFAVWATATRPARFYSNGMDGSFSHLVRPLLSPTWIVPTRHPEKLRAFLGQ